MSGGRLNCRDLSFLSFAVHLKLAPAVNENNPISSNMKQFWDYNLEIE